MGRAITLAAGPLSLSVDPAGGVIRRFDCRLGDGRDWPLFLADAGRSGVDALTAACFPMVPFAGRIGHGGFTLAGRFHPVAPRPELGAMPLHGDGLFSLWEVPVDGLDPAAGRLTLITQGTGGGPFRYRARQSFALTSDALQVTLAITNQGDAPMVMGFGLHPFLPRTPATTLTARAARVNIIDADILPIGAEAAADSRLDFALARPLPALGVVDHALLDWDGQAQVHWQEAGLMLTVQADRSFPVLQLYRPIDYGPAELPFFCLEPQSHAPDAVHWPDHGPMALLAPGEALSGTVRFRPVPLG